MSTRVKTVFNSTMVAHVWANRSQEYGRTATKNFYFEGDTIYSYGRHFPIARHVQEKNKAPIVLFTTASYSNTTSGHKCDVRHALRNGTTVFTVKDVLACDARMHRENFADYRSRLAAVILKFGKSRLYKNHLLNEARALVNEANAYAEYFNLRMKGNKDQYDCIALPSTETMEAQAKLSLQAYKEKRKADETKAAQNRAKLDAEYAEKCVQWRNGEDVYLNYHMYSHANGPILLRVKGERVETSRGAEVPLREAQILFSLVKRCKDHNEAWTPDAPKRIGLFTVNSVTAEGTLTAGCHTILWPEIERLAKSQNWM